MEYGSGHGLLKSASMKVTTHKDLVVWRKSIDLASKVYSATNRLPDAEKHGLQAQMRRSAVSVASNIAEGAGRTGRAEYIRFLNIARGSLTELETQVYIISDLRLLEDRELRLKEDVAEVGRLLTSLIQKLREQQSR
jgi:four helix bundle protein